MVVCGALPNVLFTSRGLSWFLRGELNELFTRKSLFVEMLCDLLCCAHGGAFLARWGMRAVCRFVFLRIFLAPTRGKAPTESLVSTRGTDQPASLVIVPLPSLHPNQRGVPKHFDQAQGPGADSEGVCFGGMGLGYDLHPGGQSLEQGRGNGLGHLRRVRDLVPFFSWSACCTLGMW